jgi:TIR domain-containing protein
LRHAKIILFFVSPHFIESRYINDVEVAEALKRHKAGEATVIPVILRPCPWQELFGHLQAVPKDGRPITKWENQDEACLDVANRIVEVVRSFDETRKAQRRWGSPGRRPERKADFQLSGLK